MFPAFHGVFQFYLESNLPRSGTGNYKMTDLIFKINKTKQNKKASEIGRRSHCVTLHGSKISGSQQTVVLQMWRPRQSLRSHLSSLMRRNRLIGERTTTILSTHFELFEYSNKEFKMSLRQRQRERLQNLNGLRLTKQQQFYVCSTPF